MATTSAPIDVDWMRRNVGIDYAAGDGEPLTAAGGVAGTRVSRPKSESAQA